MKIKSVAFAACVAVCASASAAMASIPANTGSVSIGSAGAAVIGTGPTGAVLNVSTAGGTSQAQLYEYIGIGLAPNSYFSLSQGELLTLPLTITYSSTTAVGTGPYDNSSTTLQVASFGGSNFSNVRQCSSDSSGCGATGTVTESFDFWYALGLANGQIQTQPYIEVYMQAVASGGNASAYLDPIIALDPNGTNANLFQGVTLTTSAIPPLTAVSAAPEPGAWLLMMLGVGSVGAALRFRRRAADAPSAA